MSLAKKWESREDELQKLITEIEARYSTSYVLGVVLSAYCNFDIFMFHYEIMFFVVTCEPGPHIVNQTVFTIDCSHSLWCGLLYYILLLLLAESILGVLIISKVPYTENVDSI